MVRNPSQAHTIPAAEQPIVTEGNTAYGRIQNTSLVQLDNAMNQPIATEETNYANPIELKTVEQPIATEENTAYGITEEINSAAQAVDQQNNGQSETAADETVYEAIPTNSDTEEFDAFAVWNTSPDGMEGENFATEGNIAYGMARDISSSAQPLTAPFIDQHQQHSTAGDEAVYQVIPTRDATEESPTLGMVHNTTSDNAMEHSITTEGNISYGIAQGLDSSTTSFDQHKTQNEQSSTGEGVYEAIPTGNANDESTYDYPKFSSEVAHENPPEPPGDTSLPLQQQMDMTNVKEDPYYI